MWYVLKDVVPANTTEPNRRETKIRVSGGILHSIVVLTPPGSGNYLRWRLKKASYYILPRNEDQYITGEHLNITYKEWLELKAAENTLTLEAWNTARLDSHEVRLMIGILPKKTMEMEEETLKTLRLFMRMFRRRT